MLRAAVRLALVLTLLAAGLGGPGCGDGAGPDTGAGEPRGRVFVFAAASLTDAFQEIAAEFQSKFPAVSVAFNFAGTPTLRTQIEQGAPADVFASADRAQMDLAVRSGAVAGSAAVFARNVLVVITPRDNPGRIGALPDLARGGLRLVIANPDVPVGAYTRQMLAALAKDPSFGAGFGERVLRNAVSLESNVKQVVAKVELGEADAGIVYGSDVTHSLTAKLQVISVPSQFNVVAEYPIASTRSSRNPAAGRAFIEFVLSPAGQAVLKRYGFAAAS